MINQRRATAVRDEDGDTGPGPIDASSATSSGASSGANGVRGGGAGHGAGAGAGAGGEVIVIPKQLRMEWTDAMAFDAALTPAAFRVGAVIGHHLNRQSGEAHPSQATLAALTGLSARGVRQAIAALEARGWLVVDRRELGTRASDGRRVCGGRGVANVYRPACGGAAVTATDRGRRLAERAAELKAARQASGQASRAAARTAESRNRGATFAAAKEEPGCHLSDPERRNGAGGKEERGFLPTLASPAGKNPSGARAGAAPALPDQVAAALQRRIGTAAMRSWFADVALGPVTGPPGRRVGVLIAPGGFVRDHIAASFARQLLAAWREVAPDIDAVEVIVAERPG